MCARPHQGKSNKHTAPGDTLTDFFSDTGSTPVDDQVIEVPKGKKAMQIGTFRYETKLGEKVVPVIKFQ